MHTIYTCQVLQYTPYRHLFYYNTTVVQFRILYIKDYSSIRATLHLLLIYTSLRSFGSTKCIYIQTILYTRSAFIS